MEPGYGRAHALLAWAVWWTAYCYWYPDTREGYRRAAVHANDALSSDPGDPWARMVLGLCLSTDGQHERALGRMAFGWALLRTGRFDEAIEETGRAIRMSPLDSFSGFYTSIHGLALLAAKRFKDALPFLHDSVAGLAELPGHYNCLISCCGHLGLIDEAKEFIAVRNRIGPPLRLSVLRANLGKFAHRDIFIDGLKKAGIPE